jgi:hypothetical protein
MCSSSCSVTWYLKDHMQHAVRPREGIVVIDVVITTPLASSATKVLTGSPSGARGCTVDSLPSIGQELWEPDTQVIGLCAR